MPFQNRLFHAFIRFQCCYKYPKSERYEEAQ